MPNSVVIGIGNPIRKDDGIGVHAVRFLEGKVPEGVELVEGSVFCADLLPFLEDRDRAIFIDSIDANEEPGAVFRFSPDDVTREQAGVPLSIHDFGLYDLIATARLLDQCPKDITIFAVQVKSIEAGLELTGELEKVLPRLCEMVIEEIGGSSE